VKRKSATDSARKVKKRAKERTTMVPMEEVKKGLGALYDKIRNTA